MLRTRLRAPRARSALFSLSKFCQARRSITTQLPTSPRLNEFAQNGVKELFDPDGFDIAYTQYTRYLLEQLNFRISGTVFEGKTPKDIAIQASREPHYADVFNYASMAHNNHFFFEGLTSDDQTIPSVLKETLIASFGSIETLHDDFIHTAMAMFGPGFVWLVKAPQTPGQPNAFRILNTYLAGSPWPQAHWRRQSVDMNTVGGFDASGREVANQYFNTVAGMAKGELPDKDLTPGTMDIVPVLCLNTWDYCYMPTFGVGVGGVGGKEAYVNHWWRRVDWKRVMEMADLDARDFQRT